MFFRRRALRTGGNASFPLRRWTREEPEPFSLEGMAHRRGFVSHPPLARLEEERRTSFPRGNGIFTGSAQREEERASLSLLFMRLEGEGRPHAAEGRNRAGLHAARKGGKIAFPPRARLEKETTLHSPRGFGSTRKDAPVNGRHPSEVTGTAGRLFGGQIAATGETLLDADQRPGTVRVQARLPGCGGMPFEETSRRWWPSEGGEMGLR
jgi:hypothetical protein